MTFTSIDGSRTKQQSQHEQQLIDAEPAFSGEFVTRYHAILNELRSGEPFVFDVDDSGKVDLDQRRDPAAPCVGPADPGRRRD